MKRETDLVTYLPQYLQNYEEQNSTLTAENPEFNLAWNAVDGVLYNEFIMTADEYGISRYEKMLNIYPAISDTLDMRRLRVQNRWFNAIPYTLKMLIAKMAELLGEFNFSLFMAAYMLTLTVYAIDDSQKEELNYLLSTMIPVNIVTDVIYESVFKGLIYWGGTMSEADIIEIIQR